MTAPCANLAWLVVDAATADSRALSMSWTGMKITHPTAGQLARIAADGQGCVCGLLNRLIA